MECHITPPPQHKRAPKTSDISKEYPDYRKSSHEEKPMQELKLPPWGPVPPNIQYRLYLAEHTNVTKCHYYPLKTSRMLVLQ